jgi:two-component system, chemotaxis family, chemotaxis protein CheY
MCSGLENTCRDAKKGLMGKVILITDDSASIRQMVSLSLKGSAYEVIEAVDGKDAIAKLNGTPIHMLITDINMPNMDGIQLIREVRANPVYKFIPIIMLTTESQEEKKQEGKNAGASGWIVKPFKPEQILAVAKKMLT